jgi:hypothetical protein
MAEDAEDCVTVKEELDEDEDGRRSEANFSPVFIVPSSKEDELPRYGADRILSLCPHSDDLVFVFVF